MAYKNDLQKYYVGFYGRPADPEGLEYWNDVLEGLDVEEDAGFDERFALIKEYFAGTAEGGEQAEYDMVVGELSNEELVDLIYNNLFNRDATEDDGRDFWVTELDEGNSTPITIVYDIINGIEEGSDDEAIFNNKLEVANYFTNNLGDAIYATDDISDAMAVLAMVDGTADSITAAKAATDDWIAGQPVVDPPEPGTGESFWLTEARDMGWAAGDEFYGTADDDTYYGDVLQNMLGQQVNSLGTGDRLDGNGGQNTLMAQVTEGAYVGNSNMPVQARTKNIQDIKLEAMNADMDDANSDVYVNAKHMWGIDQIWSWESNANLIVKDLTTLMSDGDHGNARNTSEITVGMGYTGTNDTNWDESDLHVYFDQDYLLSGQESESRAFYFLLDQDSDLVGGPLLDRINVDGIRFTVNEGEVITLSNPDARLANTHAEFVAALQEDLEQLIADGRVPEDTTLTVSSTRFDTTFLDDGSISSQIPAIVLETETNKTFESVGFSQAEDAIGDYNVYGRMGEESGTEDQPLSVKVALEKAGRGGDGGELIIGSMDKYNEGINVFDVTVYGDEDRPSSLSDMDSTGGGALSHIYITSDNGDADTYADLAIGNGNSTGTTLNNGMVLVQSNGFMGDLSLGTSANPVNNLGTLNTTDMSGSTTFWGDYDAIGLYRVNTGAGSDIINIDLDGDAVDTVGNGLMIQSGAGDDIVTVMPDPDYNVSQLTMNELRNLSIDAGSGDDDVEIGGNFRFYIDAGAGSDFVYINSQASVGQRVSGETGQWVVSTATGPSTFADRVLYKAELTVTFAGFESTVDVQTDANGKFIADQLTINDAIKAAIDESPELYDLLDYADGTADQQLIITSEVDGANMLAIDLFQPALVAANVTPVDGEVNLTAGEAGSLLEGIVITEAGTDSDTDPMAYLNANLQGSLNADGSVGTAGAGAVNSDDFQAPMTGGSADAAGVDNVNFSVISMGSGANDLVVLDSNDASANILEFDGTFGKVSVVNFFDDAALTVVGNHALDFTHYLDNVTSASTGQSTVSQVDVPVTLNTTATAAANSVSMLTLSGTATESFAGLTASNLVTALNGDGTAADNYANITNSTLSAVANTTNLVGNTQDHIVMVENADNLGEYKVFYLTSTIDSATGTTDGDFDTGATLLGTLDFGNSINFNLVGSAGWDEDYLGWLATADGIDPVGPGNGDDDDDDDDDNGDPDITDITLLDLLDADADDPATPFDAGAGMFRFDLDAGEEELVHIENFSDDDILMFENAPTGLEGDFNVIQDAFGDDEAFVSVGSLEIQLLGLENGDGFNNAATFKAIYGEDSLVFA